MFRFTIITASYNRIENLKILYSCIFQNKNHLFSIEWIVIVEKNDIDTIKFLKSIKKKEIIIRIVKNNYPEQFTKLFKEGIRKMSGDYFIILGDDDIILNNSLIKLYKFIKKESPDWIISPADYHYNKKKVRNLITYLKTKIIVNNFINLLPVVNYLMTPGVIVSRNLILKVNYFQDDVGTSNDWSTWLDLLKISRPHIFNKILSSAGYDFYSISGSLNLNKYFFLCKIVFLRKYNLIIKFTSFFIIILIFFYNFFFKNIIFLKRIFLKTNIIIEKKKIVHITRKYDQLYQKGGIEQFIHQVQKKIKIDQEILTYSDKQSDLSNKFFFESNSSKVFYFKKTLNILNDFFSFSLYYYLIKQQLNYKVIHLHQPHPFSYLYILLLPFKKKVILTYHSDILKYKILKFFIYFLNFISFNYIDCFHFSSRKFKNSSNLSTVKKYFIESFSTVKEKIIKKNIKSYFIKKNLKNYVLFIGRARHYKGFDKLKKIILQNTHINFICITDYKFDFKSKNLKIYNNINNHEKSYLIKNSYIHINTSDNEAESFGFSILESLSFGVPVIAFKLRSGTNFLVKNNINGYIINNFNINLFSEKINYLYNNKSLYKILKKNTSLDYKRRLVHNYEILYDKYMHLLNS